MQDYEVDILATGNMRFSLATFCEHFVTLLQLFTINVSFFTYMNYLQLMGFKLRPNSDEVSRKSHVVLS